MKTALIYPFIGYLSLFSYGCSTVEENYFDCSSGQCVDGLLSHSKKTTNSRGDVDFGGLRAKVTDEDGKQLQGITVHYLTRGGKSLVVAVDSHGRYYPQIESFSSDSSSTSQDALSALDTLEQRLQQPQKPQRLQQPLVSTIAVVLGAVKLGYEIYKTMSQSERGELLGSEDNVNRYCMTLEQMQISYIDVPAGLILLAAEQAGYSDEEIKTAVTTPLQEIFERYIEQKYGRHSGYEVRVPKITRSVCGSDDVGTICDINDGRLDKIWSPEVPIWEIVGPCDPNSNGSEPQESYVRITRITPDNHATSDDCIYFDQRQDLNVNVAYSYCDGDIPTGEHAELHLILSSHICPKLDQKMLAENSGELSMPAEFFPPDCYGGEPLSYRITAQLRSCNDDGCSTINSDSQSIDPCE